VITVLQAFEFLAALCAALFAGAALYINAAEHPARMELETRIAALQWAPSYKRLFCDRHALPSVQFPPSRCGNGSWDLLHHRRRAYSIARVAPAPASPPLAPEATPSPLSTMATQDKLRYAKELLSH
jgi:hypothetical protein